MKYKTCYACTNTYTIDYITLQLVNHVCDHLENLLMKTKSPRELHIDNIFESQKGNFKHSLLVFTWPFLEQISNNTSIPTHRDLSQPKLNHI